MNIDPFKRRARREFGHLYFDLCNIFRITFILIHLKKKL